jgi:FkbM family methyltransferase
MVRLLFRLFKALPPGLVQRLSRVQIKGRRRRNLVIRLTAPLRRRDLPILSGVAAGMRINLGSSYVGFVTGEAERSVQEALARIVKPGDVVYDLGANVGFFTLVCARLVGPGGAVYAFEPMPANVATLRHNVAINGLENVHVVECAASSSTGSATLLISHWSAFHRLEGKDQFRSEQEFKDTGRMTVPTITIDDFVDRDGVSPPTLVKIDVEGAELAVLQGMARTLDRLQPVLLCELHWNNAEYAELVESLGYEARSLDGSSSVAAGHYNEHTVAVPRGTDEAAWQRLAGAAR